MRGRSGATLCQVQRGFVTGLSEMWTDLGWFCARYRSGRQVRAAFCQVQGSFEAGLSEMRGRFGAVLRQVLCGFAAGLHSWWGPGTVFGLLCFLPCQVREKTHT